MKLTALALIVVGATVALLVASGAAAAAPLLQTHGGGGGGSVPGPGPGGGGGMDGTTLTTATSADFSGSGNCAFCHSQLTDAAGNDVSIHTHWRSTMMGNSANDPLWQAKVESEIARSPQLRTTIQEKCPTCHMPMARTQADVDGTPIQVLGTGGFLDPANPLNDLAIEGVSCTLCHQIQDAGLGTIETFSGHYPIDTSTEVPYRLIYGQYSNPMQQQMQMNVGYTPVHGSQAEDSALCGTCHTLFTPYVDANGAVVEGGNFPEQAPYLEWLHSDFGDGSGADTSCQQCHMPLADGAVAISNRPMTLAARDGFAQHNFVGGNVFTLRLLQANAAQFGLTTTPYQFEATLSRTLEQLGTQTGRIGLVQSTRTNDALTLTVDVQSLAGHKLPSGFPLRRAWIHLLVTDRKGNIVFESGQPLPDGQIAGNDADLDASGASFEPHYDLIDSPSQVQIYESIMKDTGGNVTYILLRGADYAKDNRLLPLGFDKETASPDVAVHGHALGDSNFVGGSDRISYEVSTAGYKGALTVTARLVFQPVSYRFAQDLLADSGSLVQRFGGYYATVDKSPALIAELKTTIR